MLLAHYRAIFKHAYVKGLATAVVVGSLGLTGTAQATAINAVVVDANGAAVLDGTEQSVALADTNPLTIGGANASKGHKDADGDTAIVKITVTGAGITDATPNGTLTVAGENAEDAGDAGTLIVSPKGTVVANELANSSVVTVTGGDGGAASIDAVTYSGTGDITLSGVDTKLGTLKVDTVTNTGAINLSGYGAVTTHTAATSALDLSTVSVLATGTGNSITGATGTATSVVTLGTVTVGDGTAASDLTVTSTVTTNGIVLSNSAEVKEHGTLTLITAGNEELAGGSITGSGTTVLSGAAAYTVTDDAFSTEGNLVVHADATSLTVAGTNADATLTVKGTLTDNKGTLNVTATANGEASVSASATVLGADSTWAMTGVGDKEASIEAGALDLNNHTLAVTNADGGSSTISFTGIGNTGGTDYSKQITLTNNGTDSAHTLTVQNANTTEGADPVDLQWFTVGSNAGTIVFDGPYTLESTSTVAAESTMAGITTFTDDLTINATAGKDATLKLGTGANTFANLSLSGKAGADTGEGVASVSGKADSDIVADSITTSGTAAISFGTLAVGSNGISNTGDLTLENKGAAALDLNTVAVSSNTGSITLSGATNGYVVKDKAVSLPGDITNDTAGGIGISATAAGTGASLSIGGNYTQTANGKLTLSNDSTHTATLSVTGSADFVDANMANITATGDEDLNLISVGTAVLGSEWDVANATLKGALQLTEDFDLKNGVVSTGSISDSGSTVNKITVSGGKLDLTSAVTRKADVTVSGGLLVLEGDLTVSGAALTVSTSAADTGLEFAADAAVKADTVNLSTPGLVTVDSGVAASIEGALSLGTTVVTIGSDGTLLLNNTGSAVDLPSAFGTVTNAGTLTLTGEYVGTTDPDFTAIAGGGVLTINGFSYTQNNLTQADANTLFADFIDSTNTNYVIGTTANYIYGSSAATYGFTTSEQYITETVAVDAAGNPQPLATNLYYVGGGKLDLTKLQNVTLTNTTDDTTYWQVAADGTRFDPTTVNTLEVDSGSLVISEDLGIGGNGMTLNDGDGGKVSLTVTNKSDLELYGTVNGIDALSAAEGSNVTLSGAAIVSAASANFTDGTLTGNNAASTLITSGALKADAANLQGTLVLDGGTGSTIGGTNTDTLTALTLNDQFALSSNLTLDTGTVTLGAAKNDADNYGLVLSGNGYAIVAPTLNVGPEEVVVDGSVTLGSKDTALTVNGLISGDADSVLTLKSTETATDLSDKVDVGTLNLTNGAYTVTDGEVKAKADINVATTATVTLGADDGDPAVADTAGVLSASGNITLGNNSLQLRGSGDNRIDAAGTLTVGTQDLDGTLTLENGTGTTSLTNVTAAGDLTLSTDGNGAYTAATIAAAAAENTISANLTVDGAKLSVTSKVGALNPNQVTVTGPNSVLDLSGVSAEDLDLSTVGGIVVANDAGVKVGQNAMSATATSSKVVTAFDWDGDVNGGGAGIALAGGGNVNVTGYSAYTSDVSNAAAFAGNVGGTTANVIFDWNWTDATETDGVVTVNKLLNTGAGIDKAPGTAAKATADTDGVYDLGGDIELATLDLVTSATAGSTAANQISLGGHALSLDGTSAGGAYITSDASTTTVNIDGAGSALNLNNTGTLDVIEGHDNTTNASPTAAQIAAQHSAAGQGILNINEGTAGNPLSEISSSSSVTLGKIGYNSADSDTGAVTFNRIGNVNVGKGSLTVTGDTYASGLTLGSGTKVSGALVDLTGDIISDEYNNGTLTASELVLAGAGAQTIASTNVTADALILSNYENNKARLVSVVDGENGRSSVVDVGTLSLGGNTLFIDPSIVYTKDVISYGDADGEDATSNNLVGNVVIGAASGFYVGATEANLDTYIKLNDAGVAVPVATNKVNSQALDYDAVGFVDQTLVIGNAKYDEDGDLSADYRESGINIDPLLTSDLVDGTAGEIQYTQIKRDTAAAVAATSYTPDTYENTIRVSNDGLLVVSNAITFTNNGSVTPSTVDLTAGNLYTVTGTGTLVDPYVLNVDSDGGTAGQLLLLGSASIAADQILLEDAKVYVGSGADATLTGLAALNTDSEPTAVGIDAVNTKFVIASDGKLTLDNNGGEDYAAEINNANGRAAANANFIAGELVLDGYFKTTNVDFSNHPATANTAYTGTLTIASGSDYTVQSTEGSNVETFVTGFRNVVNEGTLTISGDATNGQEASVGDNTNITNNGEIYLKGYAHLGDSGTDTLSNYSGTAKLTNNGTITATGVQNYLWADRDGTDSQVGTFTQAEDGVLQVGTVVNNVETLGNLSLYAEKFNFKGAVNTTANSTFTVYNDAQEEDADLTKVTFANNGTVVLRGQNLGDYLRNERTGYILTSSQLDSTATSLDSGSLIWYSAAGSEGNLVITNANVKVDNADLSLADASHYDTLSSDGNGFIRATGTVTLDDTYNFANLNLFTSELSTSADKLTVSNGDLYVVDTLKANAVVVDGTNGSDVYLGLRGEALNAGNATLTAQGGGTITIRGDSSSVGALFAGEATTPSDGAIIVRGETTAASVNTVTAGSTITVNNDMTLTGELTLVAPTTVGTNGLIINNAEVYAQKGLNVAKGSISLNNAALHVNWSDMASGTIPESTTAATLVTDYAALDPDFAQGAVKTNSVTDEVVIDGYSGSPDIQQYANLRDIVLYDGKGAVGNVSLTGVTYDVNEEDVAGYDATANAITQENLAKSLAPKGEFFKNVNVTDVTGDTLTGTQVWGTATLKSGVTTLNIGTATADGYLELTGPKVITDEDEEGTESTTNLYVATAADAAANVVLGADGGATSGVLVLNGSGSLGSVTFNDDDSELNIFGTSDAQAKAVFNKIIDGSADVNNDAGALGLEYADLSVTQGDVSLDSLKIVNGSIEAVAGDVKAQSAFELDTATVTAAEGIDLTAGGRKVVDSVLTAKDGNINVLVDTVRNNRVITNSRFTASDVVTVAGGRTVSGNTLTAGTNASLTVAPVATVDVPLGISVKADNAFTVTDNEIHAGSDSIATLDASGVSVFENEVGEYVASVVTGNKVIADKDEETSTRVDSQAVFTVGDGLHDAQTFTLIKRNIIAGNTVEADTVKYTAGEYNQVVGDKVAADTKFAVDLGTINNTYRDLITTVAGSTFTAGGVAGTDAASTIKGQLTAADTVTVTDGALKLSGALEVLNESTVQSQWLNLNDQTLFIDPAYVWTGSVTTQELTDNNTLDGDVIVGDGSALYIGADDAANNDLANVSALKAYLADKGEFKNYDSVAYIESPITLTAGSDLVVDDDLTADTYAAQLALSTYLGNDDRVYVGEGDALVITNDALGEQNEDGNYTQAALTLVGGGAVDIDGTLALENVNVWNGETLQVFSGSTTADAANIKVGNNLFSGELSDAGVVTTKYDEDKAADYLAQTDDSIADAIKAFADASTADNQFVASSFVNKALNFKSANEAGKALNSAARFAILGGAVQNAQVAQRAYTDAIEERMGFFAKTSSNIGEVKGTDVTVWVTPQYSYSDSDGYSAGKSGGYGMDSKLWGIALGADVAFQNGLTAGMAFHGGSGKSDKNGGGFAKTHSDFTYFGVSLYGAYQYQGFKVLGDFTFTNTRNDIDQDNPVGKIKDKFDTNLYSIGLTGKYDFTFEGGVTVTPHLGVRWSHFKVDSFTASVDGADSIKGKSFNGDQVTFPVGVGVSKDFRTKNGWALKPAADFSIIPVAGDRDVKSKIVSNNIEMSAKSDISDAVLFRGRVGFDAQYKNFGLGIGYTYLGSKNTSSHSFSVTARYTF